MDLEFILEAAGQGLLVIWTQGVEDREELTSVPELLAGTTGRTLALPREMQETRRERPGEEGGLPLAVEAEAGIYGRGSSCRRTWRASPESGTSCRRA